MTRPVNTAELQIMELDDLRIREFHPQPDGKGDPTEVHLTFSAVSMPYIIFAIRFKSKQALDEILAALVTHRDSVWPSD